MAAERRTQRRLAVLGAGLFALALSLLALGYYVLTGCGRIEAGGGPPCAAEQATLLGHALIYSSTAVFVVAGLAVGFLVGRRRSHPPS